MLFRSVDSPWKVVKTQKHPIDPSSPLVTSRSTRDQSKLPESVEPQECRKVSARRKQKLVVAEAVHRPVVEEQRLTEDFAQCDRRQTSQVDRDGQL